MYKDQNNTNSKVFWILKKISYEEASKICIGCPLIMAFTSLTTISATLIREKMSFQAESRVEDGRALLLVIYHCICTLSVLK